MGRHQNLYVHLPNFVWPKSHRCLFWNPENEEWLFLNPETGRVMVIFFRPQCYYVPDSVESWAVLLEVLCCSNSQFERPRTLISPKRNGAPRSNGWLRGLDNLNKYWPWATKGESWGPPSFARASFLLYLFGRIFLATYQTTSSMLFERHPLHQEGCICSACVLLTVSINRCFDKFLILAKRGILFGATKEVIKKQEKWKKHKRTKDLGLFLGEGGAKILVF